MVTVTHLETRLGIKTLNVSFCTIHFTMNLQVVTIILGLAFTNLAQAQTGILCQDSKLDEFTSTIDACSNLAELDFFSALISGDDILGPLCTSFEEKVSFQNYKPKNSKKYALFSRSIVGPKPIPN